VPGLGLRVAKSKGMACYLLAEEEEEKKKERAPEKKKGDFFLNRYVWPMSLGIHYSRHTVTTNPAV